LKTPHRKPTNLSQNPTQLALIRSPKPPTAN
jgi:hypothetical protein